MKEFQHDLLAGGVFRSLTSRHQLHTGWLESRGLHPSICIEEHRQSDEHCGIRNSSSSLQDGAKSKCDRHMIAFQHVVIALNVHGLAFLLCRIRRLESAARVPAQLDHLPFCISTQSSRSLVACRVALNAPSVPPPADPERIFHPLSHCLPQAGHRDLCPQSRVRGRRGRHRESMSAAGKKSPPHPHPSLTVSGRRRDGLRRSGPAVRPGRRQLSWPSR